MSAPLLALVLGTALQETAVPGSADPQVLPKTLRTLLIGALFEAGHEDLARRILDSPPTF